jgi:hypothetical protein
LSDLPIIVIKRKIDKQGRVPLGADIMRAMKFAKGEEVEIRCVEGASDKVTPLTMIQKVPTTRGR